MPEKSATYVLRSVSLSAAAATLEHRVRQPAASAAPINGTHYQVVILFTIHRRDYRL